MADIHLPRAGLIFLMVTLAYLFLAVKVNSEISPGEEDSEGAEEMMI
jgi:hypothetical protein